MAVSKKMRLGSILNQKSEKIRSLILDFWDCVLKFLCEPKRTSCSRILLRAKIVKIFGFIKLFFSDKKSKNLKL